MEDFDDEIIDLEEDPIIDLDEPESSVSEPVSKPSITKEVTNKAVTSILDKNKNASLKRSGHVDPATSKLQNITSKQNPISLPSSQPEEKNELQETVHKAKSKVAGEAITVATAGAIPEPVAEALAGQILNKAEENKKKIIKIIVIISSIFLLFLIGIVVSITSSDADLGKNTIGYVTGDMSEDELIRQLMYYGYCKSESSCKKKGIYKFYEKLKKTYEEYSENCPATLTNDKPCEVHLNTALILETINYYQNALNGFDAYEDNNVTEETVSSFFSGFVQIIFKKKKELDNNLNDVDSLALAQAEYVKESCRYLTQEEKTKDLEDKKVDNKQDEHVNYFYQISFNKYVSYLKYGTSSSHPNYQGTPVEIENEICAGPHNDYITTSYQTNTGSSNLTLDPTTNKYSVSGTGTGVEIANYALQFVGNPYVYGGTDLINGADCSGFTMKVMEHFGISLPHNAKDQANYGTNIGTDISNALPGDLIIYYGHVAIYLGNDTIVHASSPKTGIKVSENASYRKIFSIVRVWS